MDWLKDFFVQNIILFIFGAALYFSAIARYKHHPRISLYTTLIITNTLALAAFTMLENYAKEELNPDLTLVCSVFGYILRPTCLYLFYLLFDDSKRVKYYILAAIPLMACFVVYMLCFTPLKEYIVSFVIVETPEGGAVVFEGGILRYTSHIVATFYLLILIVMSFTTMKFKRLYRSITVLICVALVVLSVLVETFFNGDGNIHILNSTAAFCTFIYYLYLQVENYEIDDLTGLYNSDQYFKRVEFTTSNISGVIVIQFRLPDSNGDKAIDKENNDVLVEVAKIVFKTITRNMTAYRVDYDRYIILANNANEDELMDIYQKIKSRTFSIQYRIDIGYAYRTEKSEYLHVLLRQADRMINLDNN